MQHPNNSASGCRRQPPFDNRPHHRNCSTQEPPPFHRPPYHQQRWKSQQYPSNYRDRAPPARPNFIVQLRPESQRGVNPAETEAVIQRLKFQPQKANLAASNYISAGLFYEQWSEALGTVVQLWEMRLNEKGFRFLPRVVSNVELPSDRLEMNDRLKVLFLEKLKGLKEGELVEKWRKKLGDVMDEIKGVSRKLSKNSSTVPVFNELRQKRESLEGEKKVISNRIEEFRVAIRSIEEYIEDGKKLERNVEVLRFDRGKIDWVRVYMLMMRECRRLDDGLPIYAHRMEILKQIHCQQVA